MRNSAWFLLAACAGCAGPSPALLAAKQPEPQVMDLMDASGTMNVGGQWTYLPAELKPISSKSPSGGVVKSLVIVPVPGAPGWAEAKWQIVAPESLSAQRGPANVSFAWYRITVHLPTAAEGKRVEFECTVDDYAEVWVNERLDREVGQVGGSVIAGFNAPNRVVLTEHGKAGDKYQIAVFGMNGPISASPDNYIFFRNARLLLSDRP